MLEWNMSLHLVFVTLLRHLYDEEKFCLEENNTDWFAAKNY